MRVFSSSIVTLFVLLQFSVLADEAAFTRFGKWMERIVDPTIGTMITLKGRTLTKGIPCELYISRRNDGYFYLSLGVGEFIASDPLNATNHYFGTLVTPEKRVNVSDRIIHLWYSGPYIEGGASHANIALDVEVRLDENQTPIRASGQSTLQPERQVCILGEPLIS